MQTNEGAEEAATAAEKWLALVDASDFGESWNQTSSLFKSGVSDRSLFKPAVSKQQWQSSLASVRPQLGRAVTHRLKLKQYAEQLPGEPEGEYVVLKYEPSFERMKLGTETVILVKDTDGIWRVSGYNIIMRHI